MKSFGTFLILLIISSISTICLAKVELIVWQSAPQAPRVILPRLENENSKQAVERYLKNIQQNLDMQKLTTEGLPFDLGNSIDLTKYPLTSRVRMSFIANMMSDMLIQGDRIMRNINTFALAGADPFVIGLSADLLLSTEDANDFRNKIAEQFSLLVSLGGDDISPELYNQKTTFARNLNPTRDRSELALVKTFKEKAKGMFFGICRGHQMGAIADGHQLYQDLSEHGVANTHDHISSKGTDSKSLQTWHHIIINNSLLSRFLKQTNPMTNSIHHQAVKLDDDGRSVAVAFDDTGKVIEALQAKNHKGLSVQFHPEFPADISGNEEFSKNGFQIIKGIVSYSRLLRSRNANQCSALFN